jgi:hypothetical protein
MPKEQPQTTKSSLAVIEKAVELFSLTDGGGEKGRKRDI